MELSIVQSVLLIVLAGLVPVDKYGMTFGLRWPVITSVFAGLIVGDMPTALYIGGTLQLMSLGIASVGGSSVPEYGVGVVVAVAIAATSGGGVEAGLAIGIPVAMLMVQFDVLAKLSCGALVQHAQKLANEKNFSGMYRTLLCGPVLSFLTAAIPMAIAVFVGGDMVNAVLNALPAWFTGGLTVASKMLPVVGVALLLTYMPANKFFAAVMLGFVLVAYFSMSMLGVAIVGAIVCLVYWGYCADKNAASANNTVMGELEDE